MGKPIGPTFMQELKGAGLDPSMIPFSWRAATGDITFEDSVPVATRNVILAVYAAHDPTAVLPVPDWGQFRNGVMAVFGNDPVMISQKMGLVPGWYDSAKAENAPFVEALTIWALQGNKITQAEYDGIKAAAFVHHIPITL